MFFRLCCSLHCYFFSYFCLLLVALGVMLPAQAANRFPSAVAEMVRRSPIPENEISLWVAPVDGGNPIVDLNSRLARSPASSIKVITTGVGLLLLGENFRWRVDFFTNGELKNGVLNGDLFIKGYGNPYLVQEKLMDMVIELRERGIDHIAGKVVLDNSYFINRHENPDAFDGAGLEPYNALPNALTINFRTVELLLKPSGNRIEISTEPKLSYLKLENQMTLNRHKRCHGKGFAPKMSVNRETNTVLVSGSMSRRCGEQRLVRVLGDAGDAFFGYFQRAWQLAGGSMGNAWVYGQVPETATLLYEGYSRPLSEQIAAMNKLSNNVMTRQLFLTIGAELTRPPATLSKARAVVLHRLQQMGIDPHRLYIDNGSGLSRTTRISAEQMGQFLLAMQDPRVRFHFEQSLSVVGVDGTLRHRLKNTPLAGNAIGKSGTLKHVKSLVGYVTAASGRKYAYVMLFSGKKSKAGRPLMDELLKWIYRTQ